MIPYLPTLGVRFDIDKIDSIAYGFACWRVFWRAIDPEGMAGVQLYEGDTAATLAGEERVYCIGIQSAGRSTLVAIRAALERKLVVFVACRFPAYCSAPIGRQFTVKKIPHLFAKAFLFKAETKVHAFARFSPGLPLVTFPKRLYHL